MLKGDIQVRCRELLIQICEAEEVEILKGRISRKLQEEFPVLKKRYWGQHFWASGYGVWSTGNITDQMVNECLEHHRCDSSDNSNFILE